MTLVIFIDLWPEANEPGQWKERFNTVPDTVASAGHRPEVIHYSRLDVPSLVAQPIGGIMLSGSRSNLMADPTRDPDDGIALSAFSAVTELLQRLPHVPVLGICFGMQYLMFAGGGTLAYMATERRDPAWPISLLEPDPLFAGLPAPRCVENHRWLVEQPAHGYRVIARSPDGIEAVRHATLPRVGIQFHPEYYRRPGATSDGQQVLNNWLTGC